jgi:hypothetical protein
MLALAFRKISFNPFKLCPLGSEADARVSLVRIARTDPARKVSTASERRGNTLEDFKNFHLKAKAITWPRLSDL